MDIGIDLGTTFSVMAIKGNRKLSESYPGGQGVYIKECDVTIIPSPLAEQTFPSVFWQDRNDLDHVLVGTEAKDKAKDGEAPIMFSKRTIGTTMALKMHDRTLTAREVATHMLRAMKRWAEQALGEPVRRAVITHPAYFDLNQVAETRQAAALAGFDMSLPEQMMMEPAAAALAYVQGDERDPLTVLTYDLGGGTFDITVVERRQGVISLKAFDGDHLLGGYNFDRALVDWILKKLAAAGRTIPHDENNPEHRARHAQLLQIAENIKLDLDRQRGPKVPVQVKVQGVLVDAAGKSVQFLDRITRDEFTQLIREEIDKTLRCCDSALEKAKLNRDAIDHVLLVGGSTPAPWIRDTVTAAFPGKVKMFDPDRCVAIGAALRAAELPVVASAAGVDLVVNAPAWSPLPTMNIAGTVQLKGSTGTSPAQLCVLLHTASGVVEATPTAGGDFVFEEIALAEREPTPFRVEVVDRGGIRLVEHSFAVTYVTDYVSEGASIPAITTSLPKPLFLKTANGFKSIGEEGVQLPAKVEVQLRRAGNESSLEIPVYQGDEEVGRVVMTGIPEHAGEGAPVVLTVEITERNAMRGTVKLLKRPGGAVEKEGTVNITFPPIAVPELTELRAQFDDIEGKRQQEIYQSPDAEQRTRLKGAGEKLARNIRTILDKPRPDPQELHRALKELDRMVTPPKEDLDPSRAEFTRSIEGCRDLLNSKASDRQLEGFKPMIDKFEKEGLDAAAARNFKKWGQINDGLTDLRRRILAVARENGNGGGMREREMPPTPTLKEQFRQEVESFRVAVSEQRTLVSTRPDYAHKYKLRCDRIEEELDAIESKIDKVEDNLDSSQAFAQLQIIMRDGRDAPKLPRRILGIPGDVWSD